jgi:hypothetical protein
LSLEHKSAFISCSYNTIRTTLLDINQLRSAEILIHKWKEKAAHVSVKAS